MFKVLAIIYFSILLSSEPITQITDTYPGGHPKEITIYLINTDTDFNSTILPSKRYIYKPDGNLHKYQEFWDNGQKSMEALIQRANIIERHWDKDGFPKDTNKINKENYIIPSPNIDSNFQSNTKNNSQSDIDEKINKIKIDLASLAIDLKKLDVGLSSLNALNFDHQNRLDSVDKQNIEKYINISEEIDTLTQIIEQLKITSNVKFQMLDEIYSTLIPDLQRDIKSMNDSLSTILEINSIKKEIKKSRKNASK